MKPDQHKKKRSAQYKKKHGIKDDKKDSKQEPKQEKKQKQSAKQASSQAGLLPPSSSDNDSDVGDQTSSQPRKSYRRREVKSNWDRYELPDVDDDTTQTLRGADMAQLLSHTSSASSQFRFEHEKDWLDEVQAEPADSDISDLLTINCSQLAEALQCVPLHKRLGIQEEAFQPHQVELFIEEASQHASHYKHEQAKSFGDRTSHVDITKSKQQMSQTSPVLSDIPSTSEKAPTTSENIPDTCDILDEILGDAGTNKCNDADNSRTSSISQASNIKANAVVSDIVDLDQILDDSPAMSHQSRQSDTKSTQDSETSAEQDTPTTESNETPVEKSQTGQTESDNKMTKPTDEPVQKSSSISTVMVTNIEDELDMLLNLDTQQSSKPADKQDSQPQGATSNSTDGLEDWLDDMLGD